MILNSVIGMMGSNYDADAALYFAQLTVQPSTDFKSAVNTLVLQLKSDGNFTKLDRLWIHAVEIQQHARVSIVNPSSTQISEGNSPTWTANQGYTGDGLTMHLKSNYVPSVDTVNYVLNSGSIGFYSRTNAQLTAVDMGGNGPTNASYVITKFSDGNCYVKLNNTQITFTSVANSDSRGLFSSVRTASNALLIYRNGSVIKTDTTASSSLPTKEIYMLGNNNDGTFQLPSTRQNAFSYIGSGSITQSTFYTALQAFATTIGFNV